MKPEINTLNQFKKYKDKWIDSFIRTHACIFGIPLEWIMAILLFLMGSAVTAYICLAKKINVAPLPVAILILAFAIAVIFTKWCYYSGIKKALGECMDLLARYEKAQYFQIDLDKIMAQELCNDKNIKRYESEITKSELAKTNADKVYNEVSEEYGKANDRKANGNAENNAEDKAVNKTDDRLEHHLKCIRNHNQKILAYDQLIEQYAKEKLLLQEENRLLNGRIKNILEIDMKAVNCNSRFDENETEPSVIYRSVNSIVGLHKQQILNKLDGVISDMESGCFKEELKLFVDDSIDRISKIKTQ